MKPSIRRLHTTRPRRGPARLRRLGALPIPLAALLAAGCMEEGAGGKKVQLVLDGDTFQLEGGERVRLLGLDAPERSAPEECYGDESFNYLSERIAGRKVRLEYDLVREDSFGRTLAWVYLGDEFMNGTLLAEGTACVLVIPPNGETKRTYLQALEDGARAAKRGLWRDCGGCDLREAAP